MRTRQGRLNRYCKMLLPQDDEKKLIKCWLIPACLSTGQKGSTNQNVLVYRGKLDWFVNCFCLLIGFLGSMEDRRAIANFDKCCSLAFFKKAPCSTTLSSMVEHRESLLFKCADGQLRWTWAGWLELLLNQGVPKVVVLHIGTVTYLSCCFEIRTSKKSTET